MIRPLDMNVFEAAKKRIEWTFDNFDKICVSFSGGKDSTCMTHMVMDEAIKRGRKVALLFIDWEIQYKMTIDHVKRVFEMYREHIDPYWVALPLLTDNACSQFEPEWICWDKDKKDAWVRHSGITRSPLKNSFRSLANGTVPDNARHVSSESAPAKASTDTVH